MSNLYFASFQTANGQYNRNTESVKMLKTNKSSVRGVSVTSAAKGSLMETINATKKPSTANRRASTKAATNIKVLGSSNKISTDANLKKMSETSMTRRSRTSTFNVNQLKKIPIHPTKCTKRNSMKLSVAGEETMTTDGNSTNAFAQPKKSSAKFNCNLCEMSFFYKTSLAAHQKSHATSNTCQHCQRSFAIPTALGNHLREHCVRISIAERKKLLVQDEKSSDLNRTNLKTPTRTPKLRRTTNKLLDLVYKSCSPSQLDRLKAVPAKHFPPIKGIRHTPRKLINCYKCSAKFRDPYSYATHAEHCVVADKSGNKVYDVCVA